MVSPSNCTYEHIYKYSKTEESDPITQSIQEKIVETPCI